MNKTSGWIIFAIKNNIPSDQDLFGIIDTMKTEMHLYRKEYYPDAKYKEDCFQGIWEVITNAMLANIEKFNVLTGELVPVIARIIQSDQVLEDIVEIAGKLEKKPKFFMHCFYFLILWEGSFKNVVKNLRYVRNS